MEEFFSYLEYGGAIVYGYSDIDGAYPRILMLLEGDEKS